MADIKREPSNPTQMVKGRRKRQATNVQTPMIASLYAKSNAKYFPTNGSNAAKTPLDTRRLSYASPPRI